MKKMLFSRLFILGLVSVMTMTMSCKKDDPFTLVDCISESDWIVSSFRVDGAEYVGNAGIYSSVELEFREYNKADQRGSVTFTRIHNDNSSTPGDTEILSGTYEIFESTAEVEITFTGYLPAIFTITGEDVCEEGRLMLEGNVGGYYWEMSARL